MRTCSVVSGIRSVVAWYSPQQTQLQQPMEQLVRIRSWGRVHHRCAPPALPTTDQTDHTAVAVAETAAAARQETAQGHPLKGLAEHPWMCRTEHMTPVAALWACGPACLGGCGFVLVTSLRARTAGSTAGTAGTPHRVRPHAHACDDSWADR